MKRRIFAFVMALMLIALLLAGCQSGNIANKSRSGVVRIAAVYTVDVYSEDLELIEQHIAVGGTGSAFGVGDAGKETQYFVTNRHVVSDIEPFISYDEKAEEYRLFAPSLTHIYILLDDFALDSNLNVDTSRAVPCEVLYRAGENEPDLAVLKAANPVPGRTALPLLAKDDDIASGDVVHALGYPSSTEEEIVMDTLGNQTYYASVEQVTITSGNVSLHSTLQDGDARVNIIQHTAPINHGNSGGPLIDDRGAVVAVNTWGWSDGSQINYGSIEISYVRDILDNLHINWTPYRPGVNVLLIGVVAAAAVVVVVIVLLVVLRRKKRVNLPVSPSEAGPGPTRPAFASAQEYRIQGVSGVFAGRRFAINEGVPVRIGTDPTANDLIIPAGTAGVSRRHCVLTLHSGQLYLQDVGSTYGTMVGSQRLVKDQPAALRMGDRFCLGSDQQCFTITGKGGV